MVLESQKQNRFQVNFGLLTLWETLRSSHPPNSKQLITKQLPKGPFVRS
jgi:hypothetical protein